MDKIKFKKRKYKLYDNAYYYRWYVYVNKIKNDEIYIEERFVSDGVFEYVIYQHGFIFGRHGYIVTCDILIDAKRTLLEELYKWIK